jgi:hypothetical protein
MRKITRKAVNIFIVIAVAGSWLAMALYGQGTLAENGFGNLKYFTVLSNLLEGAASVIWLVMSGRDESAKIKAERLKYVAASAVMLTFTVVMGFLGPLYGYGAMFTGANLFFHLIIPLAAAAEVIFLSDAEYTASDNALTVIPPLVYGTVYLLNNIVNGIGEWPDTNDWYTFLAWGYPAGIGIFAVICAVTWLLGLLMRKLQIKILAEHRQEPDRCRR